MGVNDVSLVCYTSLCCCNYLRRLHGAKNDQTLERMCKNWVQNHRSTGLQELPSHKKKQFVGRVFFDLGSTYNHVSKTGNRQASQSAGGIQSMPTVIDKCDEGASRQDFWNLSCFCASFLFYPEWSEMSLPQSRLFDFSVEW